MGIEKLLASILGIEEGKPETLDKGGYAYIEINFEDANYQGNNIRFTLPGKSCTKVEYTGDKQDATLKIGDKRADELPLSKIKSLKSIGGFNELFLSSTDSHGHLILIVSAGVISEVKPTMENEVKESKRTTYTQVLQVKTTGQADYIIPTKGKAIEVIGFNAFISQAAPTGVGSAVFFYSINDDGDYIALFKYEPVCDGVGDNAVHIVSQSDIVFRGGIDTWVILNNMTWTGGTAVEVTVTFMYREV
jgi:hypothetical protein